jgi:hypothetical protein
MNCRAKSNNAKRSGAKEVKATYRPPQLLRFGSVKDLTAGGSERGNENCDDQGAAECVRLRV